MQVTFGKHAGKSLELLMLREPGYIHWLVQQSATGPLLALKSEALKLMKRFDAKPFNQVCHSRTCKLGATRATVYGDNLVPYWWCANCDPYESGANAGKLQIVRTYADALSHVEFYCSGRKSDYVELIRYLAEAKGLPARVGEKQAQFFFA
jgi:hypothetical protein